MERYKGREKLLGFGHGAAPRAQIQGVFHCTALFTDILRYEHVFTAEKVLPFIGASVHACLKTEPIDPCHSRTA